MLMYANIETRKKGSFKNKKLTFALCVSIYPYPSVPVISNPDRPQHRFDVLS